MMQELPQRIRSKSQINYSYMTVKMTQSRIEKGLIAIPASLSKWFPKHNGIIHAYLDDSHVLQPKTFSSYESSTRECRIGGMRDWLEQNKINSGDEIVIQVMDKDNFIYRIAPERRFIERTQELQHKFDISESEQEASEKIITLAQWIQLGRQEVVISEFQRLVNIMPIQQREHAVKRFSRARERIQASLRTLLEDIYKGHCQVCDFWFFKRDNKPYFETHHLNPLQSHHPKNIVVVCGNCHNQFEHANVHHHFNGDGWLIRVSFNERIYQVNQVVLASKLEESFKELFI